jgi:hypothetical protein
LADDPFVKILIAVLEQIDAAIRNPIELQGGILKKIQMLALMWLLCGIVTHHASIVL